MCWFNRGKDSRNMSQEIEDQGESISLTLEKEKSNIKKISRKIKDSKNFIFSGCGDKYTVPLTSKFLWQYLSKKPVDVIQSWTLHEYPPKYLDKNTCVIFISQSGTTDDTVSACKSVMEKNCKVVVITNLKVPKKDSLVSLCEDYNRGHIIRTHTKAYPERSLPSTGSFHTSMTTLNLLLLCVSKNETIRTLQTDTVPRIVNELSKSNSVKKWAKKNAGKIKKYNNFYVIGDGPRFPLARKQAKIMLMEGAKVNACDVEAEEFIHSLVETLEGKSDPLILLKPLDTWEESYKIFRVIKNFWLKYAGKNKLLIIDPFEFLDKKYTKLFSGKEGDIISPFIYAPQLEWLSYHLALKKGRDPSKGELVDKVRNRDFLEKVLS